MGVFGFSLPINGGNALALAVVLIWPAAPGAQPLPAHGGTSLQAAIRSALSRNASLVLARANVELADGAMEQQEGAFNATLGVQATRSRTLQPLRESDRLAAQRAGADLSDAQADTSRFETSVSKQFPDGMQASISASHSHLRDNTLLAAGIPLQNTGVLSFQLRLPLLRNNGKASSAALQAAIAESSAARSELEFSTAQTVLTVALAYWDYLTRTERLAISHASERRAGEFLDELRKLVAADQIPRSELDLASASLSEKRATRIANEQFALEARRTLGRAMGLEGAAALSIDRLTDEFPRLVAGELQTATRIPQLTAHALDKRADLVALRLRDAAARLRLGAARSNEQPQLDVVLGLTQNSLGEGASALALGHTLARPAPLGYSIGLIFQKPLDNSAARGVSRQQSAAAEAVQARLRELGFVIENSVETSTRAVQRAADQLREAEAAVKAYATSVQSERTRRQLGMATVIDVLNIEDRYNSALNSALLARQNYANTIAQFRFETAQLIVQEGAGYSARVGDLLSPELK